MTIVHVAVRDQHVVRGGTKLGLNAQLAALDGDAVVAHRELTAKDADKAAALGIETVGVVEFLGPSMDRQSASTCSHRMGWMFHAGLLRTVKPAKLTFWHSDRKIMRGRATSRPSSGRKMFLKSLFHQLSSAKSV